MVGSHVRLFLVDWRKEEFNAGEYVMIHKGPCSLWDSLEECWVEVSWIYPGSEESSQNENLWPRSTEILPRNMMVHLSLQQMWPWMQPLLILFSSCLKKGNELPGKTSIKIFPAPHRDSTLFPVCWVNWASAQGDTSGRCRLRTPVPGTWEFVGIM